MLLHRLAADRDHLFARRLGLLGFESVLNRDYPVVFATLYIFSLIGVVVNLISDLTYTWIDPRIDFESRRSEVDRLPVTIFRKPRSTPRRQSAAVILHRFRLSPLNRRRWESFKANRRGYWSLWIFSRCS